MSTSKALVECRDVARTYGSGRAAVVALHGVHCAVAPGAQVAIVGPSGSGKSTLLHLLAGLDTPTSGTVSWPALGDGALRPWPISVVFQGLSLLPPLDVLENVAFPVLLLGVDRSMAIASARAALARFGLEDLASKLPEELSGGQAQRVAVARALATSPQLILADEPTGQLDHIAGREVIDALIETANATGAALVVSTHDPEFASRLEHRWDMTDGCLRTDNVDQPRSVREEPCSV